MSSFVYRNVQLIAMIVVCAELLLYRVQSSLEKCQTIVFFCLFFVLAFFLRKGSAIQSKKSERHRYLGMTFPDNTKRSNYAICQNVVDGIRFLYIEKETSSRSTQKGIAEKSGRNE